MSAPPIWLLDVDGVINAQDARWDAEPGAGSAQGFTRQWPMRWAPECTARIAALAAAGAVEVRWCTTWVREGAALSALFGLPTFAAAFTLNPRGDSPDRPWLCMTELKHAAALDVVRSGRRLIWTDDTAIAEMRDHRPAQHVELTGAAALLIEPDAVRGLEPEHLAAITAFCASPRGASRPA